MTAESDFIDSKISAALEKTGGDEEAALQLLIKGAIPDAMALLEFTRRTGKYDLICHPKTPDVLLKPTKLKPNQVWEAKPKWTNPAVSKGTEIVRLDVNAAYLSATNVSLPLGALKHEKTSTFDTKRSGIYLVTPPEWKHDHLPNPIGDREESGKLWITYPTLRMLLDLSTEKWGNLCDAPVIHESWTSGGSAILLRKFREALRDARQSAIDNKDELLGEYVKTMYSRFVSTMIVESRYNPDLGRSDWASIIRSQAFANLWRKSLKATQGGLTVYKVSGTDELHVIGDPWETFTEGRALSQMKSKETYVLGAPRG